MNTSKRQRASTSNDNDLAPASKRLKLELLPSQRHCLEAFEDSQTEDSKYLCCCLDFMFTTEELKSSSYGGKNSNFNGKGHRRLNVTKMQFIERMYIFEVFEKHDYKPKNLCCITSFTDLFSKRVKGNQKRLKKIPYIINKRCNNLRRITKKTQVT